MFQLGGREQEQGGRGVQTAAPLFAGFSRTTHREKWEDLPARHKNKNQMDEECILNASEMRACVCLGMCVCEHVRVRACVRVFARRLKVYIPCTILRSLL